jgi:hypothetical protein
MLEEKQSERSFSLSQHTLRCAFENDMELVFVAVYQQFLILFYIGKLLKDTKESYVKLLGGRLPTFLPFFNFTRHFDEIVGGYISQSMVCLCIQLQTICSYFGYDNFVRVPCLLQSLWQHRLT